MLAEFIVLGIIPFSTSLSFKDVQPIFREKCAQCHTATWADKNWLDYDKAFRDREKIKFRLEQYTMPPANVTDLSQEDRQKIIDWVKQGAKR